MSGDGTIGKIPKSGMVTVHTAYPAKGNGSSLNPVTIEGKTIIEIDDISFGVQATTTFSFFNDGGPHASPGDSITIGSITGIFGTDINPLDYYNYQSVRDATLLWLNTHSTEVTGIAEGDNTMDLTVILPGVAGNSTHISTTDPYASAGPFMGGIDGLLTHTDDVYLARNFQSTPNNPALIYFDTDITYKWVLLNDYKPVSFRTNGNINAVQSILNLRAGTLISLTDDGNGGIIITTSAADNQSVAQLASTGLIEWQAPYFEIVSDNQIRIKAGKGMIVDYTTLTFTLISWNDIVVTDQYQGTPDLTGTNFAIDINGAVIQVPGITAWTEDQINTLIILGFDDYTLGHITYTQAQPYAVDGPWQQFNSLQASLGAFNISGNDFFFSPSGLLKIGRHAGTSYWPNSNFTNALYPGDYNIITVPVDINPCHFQMYWSIDNHTNWVNSSAQSYDTIDPNHWDDGIGDGFGGPAIVPTGKWTIQPFMMYGPALSPTDNQLGTNDVQYGQKLYSSMQQAISHVHDAFLINPYAGGEPILGYMIIQQGCTDLNDTTKCIFYTNSGTVGNSLPVPTPPASITSMIRTPISGNVDGNNLLFVTDEVPQIIVSDGMLRVSGNGWTWDLGTMTVTMQEGLAPNDSWFYFV